MARFGAVATVGSAAALARLHLPAIVTGLHWSAAEVGLLQAALSFFLVVMLVPRALELALFPALSGAYGRRDRSAFRSAAEEALSATALALGLVAGFLLVAGPGILRLAYGEEFLSAEGALVGVLVSGWALGLAVPPIAALSGAGVVIVPTAGALLGLLASLACWVIWVPDAGATGAALGLAVGSVVTAAVPIAGACTRFRLDARPAAGTTLAAIALVSGAWVLVAVADTPPLGTGLVYAVAFAALERRMFQSLLSRVTGRVRT